MGTSVRPGVGFQGDSEVFVVCFVLFAGVVFTFTFLGPSLVRPGTFGVAHLHSRLSPGSKEGGLAMGWEATRVRVREKGA